MFCKELKSSFVTHLIEASLGLDLGCQKTPGGGTRRERRAWKTLIECVLLNAASYLLLFFVSFVCFVFKFPFPLEKDLVVFLFPFKASIRLACWPLTGLGCYCSCSGMWVRGSTGDGLSLQ